MARQPEHPLHPDLCAWAEWVRAGGLNNEGWPGISVQAPERNEGGDRPPPGPKTPRLNPAPPKRWTRISVILRRHRRDPLTRNGAEAIARYYVQREGGWSGECTRGADLVLGALAAWVD